MIDRRKLVDAIFDAIDRFVEEYNTDHETQVAVSLEGDEITIDGGHIAGLFTVTVVQDDA